MINEATIDKLREMQLDIMAETFRSQEGDLRSVHYHSVNASVCWWTPNGRIGKAGG